MPITFNEAENIWEFTNPTEEEKKSLTSIAIDSITDFFGELIAEQILEKAKKQALSEQGKEIEVEDGAFGIKAGHA